ncbi:hypothetical protein evm_011272 [Chilo suppressalis]|nr:hypothetical protein evm_011272 [Chilo suppressalis]
MTQKINWTSSSDLVSEVKIMSQTNVARGFESSNMKVLSQCFNYITRLPISDNIAGYNGAGCHLIRLGPVFALSWNISNHK